MVYSSGVVKGQVPTVYLQNLEGDSFDFGYNLALAYKLNKQVEVGVTYRSNIDLTVEGDADIFHVAQINPQRNVGASVTVPLPASLNIALAYTFGEKTTVEFLYERNFWSSYKSLNFDFNDIVAEAAFGTPKLKDWKDVNAYRFGITHLMDRYKLMAGIVFDSTPIPDSTVGLELPDSDSTSVSVGMRYQVNEKLDFGISTLYSMRDDRKVNNAALSGEFTDSDIILVSTGIGYKF
jgi:long-chain fatty acid transport protein